MVKKQCYTKQRSAKNGGGSYTTCLESQTKPKTIKITRKKKKVVKKVVAPKAGKKQCYTKKTKAGGSYTTCLESQAKPKTVKITRKKKKVVKKVVAPKPKSTREKKMSAGKSVLFTSGLMAKIGAAVITKPEIERRRIQAKREKEKLQIKATKKLRSYITRINSFRNKMAGNSLKGSSGSGTGWWEITKANASTKKKMIKKTKDMKKKYDKLKAEVDNVGSNYTQYREVSEADKQLKKILKALNSALPPSTKSTGDVKSNTLGRRVKALERKWDKLPFLQKRRFLDEFELFVEQQQPDWFVYDGKGSYIKKAGIPALNHF